VPQRRPRLTGRVVATLALGVGLGVVVPLWAFRGVDLEHSWQLACQCNGLFLTLAGGAVLLTLVLRAWRWQVLMAAQQPVRLRSCLAGICVGLLANNVLPFRLGDLVRVGVLRHHEGGSGARGLGTVAVERVLDLLTLVFLLGAYVVIAGVDRPELLAAGQLALLGGIGLSLTLVVGFWRRRWLQNTVAAPVRWVSPKLGDKVALLVGRFLEGLQVFVSLRQALLVLALSLGWWGATIAAFFCVGQALGLGLEPGAYVLVLVVTAFGALIPAAPGSVGTFHGFARLGLYLASLGSGEAALAFAAITHGLDWVLVSGTGLYFFVRDRLFLVLLTSRRAADTPRAAAPAPSIPQLKPALLCQPVVNG
jgi:uncharacterized protein (TIRG00374 family)